MEDITTIGLDIAKSMFQVHATNGTGIVVNADLSTLPISRKILETNATPILMNAFAIELTLMDAGSL